MVGFMNDPNPFDISLQTKNDFHKKRVDAKSTQKRQKYLTSFCYESSSYNEICTDESEKKPCEPVENIELMALKPM